MSVNVAASRPAYATIQNHFLDEIASGRLAEGARMPPETEIARRFGTSRATVQLAMQRLVHEGRIEKRVGSGTFVTRPPTPEAMRVVGIPSFEEEARDRGLTVAYRLLSLEREDASEALADRLRIAPGTPVLTFERIRLVDGTVIGMETRSFARDIVADVSLYDLDGASMHEIVARHVRLPIERMEAEIRAVAATAATAAKLGVAEGTPLLSRPHRMLAAGGQPIFAGEALYLPPFALRYVAEMSAD